MWLAYLRFDSEQENGVALVFCANREETNKTGQAAKEVFGAALLQYATFYSHATIRPMEVPNFSEKLIFNGYQAFERFLGTAAPGGSE